MNAHTLPSLPSSIFSGRTKGDVVLHERHMFVVLVPWGPPVRLFDEYGRETCTREPMLIPPGHRFGGTVDECAPLGLEPETVGAPLHETTGRDGGIVVLRGRTASMVHDACAEFLQDLAAASTLDALVDEIVPRITGSGEGGRPYPRRARADATTTVGASRAATAGGHGRNLRVKAATHVQGRYRGHGA